MAHFITLYYALCFSAGIGNLIFFIFIYARYRAVVIRYYLYLNMLLLLYLSLNAFIIYRRTIMQNGDILLSVILDTVFMVWYSLLFYVLPSFFHSLVDIPMVGPRRLFFLLLSAVTFMLSYVPLFMTGGLFEKLQLIQFFLNQVNVYILMGVSIYLLGMVVSNLKKIENKEAIKVLKTIVVVITLFIPGFIADANYYYMQIKNNILPYGFSFSALFCFFWNIIGVAYALRYLLSGPEKKLIRLLRVSGKEVLPSFVQENGFIKFNHKLFVVDEVQLRHKMKDS